MRGLGVTLGFILLLATSVAGHQVPAAEPLRVPLRVSLVSLMALHGADLAVTENCLGAGRCREMNPLFAPFAGSPAGFGAGKMFGASILSWYLLAQHTRHPRLTFALALAANGWYSVVVAHNLHELRR